MLLVLILPGIACLVGALVIERVALRVAVFLVGFAYLMVIALQAG